MKIDLDGTSIYKEKIIHLNNDYKEQVLDALRKVEDPDLKKSLVDLNMIKNIQVEGSNRFEVELTTPACPLKEKIAKIVCSLSKN